MLANAAHTYHVPDRLDLVDAAPLFCPGVTAYGAVDKLTVGPGDIVAIFGLGSVGHMAVQFAALTGAEVVAVSWNSRHLDVARRLGATRTIHSADTDAMRALADTADAVMTFAGADSVTEQALTALKWGGTLVSAVPLNLHDFPFNKAQTVKASLLGNRAQMRAVLQLAAEGKTRTVTEQFAMPDAIEALQSLSNGAVRSQAVLRNINVNGPTAE